MKNEIPKTVVAETAIIRPPNFAVEIRCLNCNKDFLHRVVQLADVHTAWANNSKCPSCSSKRSKDLEAPAPSKLAKEKADKVIRAASLIHAAGKVGAPPALAMALALASEMHFRGIPLPELDL